MTPVQKEVGLFPYWTCQELPNTKVNWLSCLWNLQGWKTAVSRLDFIPVYFYTFYRCSPEHVDLVLFYSHLCFVSCENSLKIQNVYCNAFWEDDMLSSRITPIFRIFYMRQMCLNLWVCEWNLSHQRLSPGLPHKPQQLWPTLAPCWFSSAFGLISSSCTPLLAEDVVLFHCWLDGAQTAYNGSDF